MEAIIHVTNWERYGRRQASEWAKQVAVVNGDQLGPKFIEAPLHTFVFKIKLREPGVLQWPETLTGVHVWVSMSL